MTRSSRHRSHRSRKHSRERSESEEEDSPRERRTREETTRVSRDPEPEKRRSSHEIAGKEMGRSSNGDISGEKKRKAREEAVVVTDRWSGGKDNDDKRARCEELGPVDLDKSSKSKATDSKCRPSRRQEGPNERDEDHGGKHESVKGKSEKDSSRIESSNHYKDVKDKESGKHSEVQEPRHDKSDDLHSRKHGPRAGTSTEEHTVKKNTKINGERQLQDIFPIAEVDKGLEKRTRNEESEEKDKRHGDSGDPDERRLSSRDHSRNRSYKDEKNENTKYKEKYRIENDRDQNHRNDKHQDERPSKDHNNDKSDKSHLRDEYRTLDSHKKKTKETDKDGASYVGDLDNKLKDSRGRKKYYNEKDDHSDIKARVAKEYRETEKNASSASRTSSHNVKPRSGYQHKENADSSPRNNRLKSSTSSSTYAGNDDNRDLWKLEESVHRVSASEDRSRPTTVSKGDSLASSGLRERNSTTRSGKLPLKDDLHSGDFSVEAATASKYNRTPRSDARTSPNQSRGRSPSANSGRRFADRSPAKYDRAASRQGLDTEIGHRSGSYRDDLSQTDVRGRESTPIGSSSINRGGFPNLLHPPPGMRHGIDSPSVLGPYQDDSRAQSSERRPYNRNKRTADLGFGRGQGNAWKGAPNWSSPAANGFIPLQHGPPPTGFHPTMSQFSAPPLFGVRPMDLTHGGVSYHMHDMAERFSGHGQTFGWHNPVDQLCHPQMQMWDRNNSMYTNDSHVYGRQEWDENGQLIGSRGWEMSSEMWKGQNDNNMDICLVNKEMESSKPSATDELAQSKCLPTECIEAEAKRSSDILTSEDNVKSPKMPVTKQTREASSALDDKTANYIVNYLSKIDISPDLAGSELYRTCKAKLGNLDNDTCSLTTHRSCQLKDGNIMKMKSTSSILKSFFPAAKEGVFKRAMSIYRKQNGRVDGKHTSAAEIVFSGEVKKEPTESSENMAVQESAAELASPEKIPPSSAGPPNDLEGGNNTVLQDKNDAAEVVAHCIGPEASETLTEDNKLNLSRIPNSDENTH